MIPYPVAREPGSIPRMRTLKGYSRGLTEVEFLVEENLTLNDRARFSSTRSFSPRHGRGTRGVNCGELCSTREGPVRPLSDRAKSGRDSSAKRSSANPDLGGELL